MNSPLRLPGVVWAFAGGKIVFHLATTRLEHHRDELYFISASKRLAASYVDFQPVTPVLVRGARLLFGESLVGLRVIPTLAGAAAIVLAALIARELGGNRRAQILAAFALTIVPTFVGMDGAVNTVSLETPAWMLVAYVTARLLRTGDQRLWLALGAAGGLAILVKFTMVAYLLGLGIGLAVTMPDRLRSRWPWLGAAIGAAMIAPSIVWQFRNDLPVLEFVGNQGGGGAVAGLRGRLGYLAGLVFVAGFVAVLLYVPGLVWLLRSRTYRALGIAHAIALVGFFVASGKGYYAAPGMGVLMCAGAVWAIQRRDRFPRALMAGIAASLILSLPLVVPLVPTSVLRENPDISDATEIGERIGWKDLAQSIGRLSASLDGDERSRAVVVGSNYTLPAAIEFYTDDYDLPVAVSGHNSSYLWWPELPRDHVAITIGFDRDRLLDLYQTVERAGTVRNSEGVQNYEWGKPIYIARGPKVSPAELRERIQIFTA